MSFTLPQNARAWIEGLVRAGISAAANSITVVVVDPSNFNLHGGLGKLAEVAVVSAIVAIAHFLSSDPLPAAPSK